MRSSVRILLVLSLAMAATIPVTGQAFAARSHHDPGPAGQDAVLAWNATATSARWLAASRPTATRRTSPGSTP